MTNPESATISEFPHPWSCYMRRQEGNGDWTIGVGVKTKDGWRECFFYRRQSHDAAVSAIKQHLKVGAYHE